MPLQSATSLRSNVVIVSRIDPTAPDGFEATLLAALNIPANDPFCSSIAATRGNQIALPIDTSRPALSDSQNRLVQMKFDCGVGELNTDCPLQPGEHETASPEGGLLSSWWQHLPPGTPVITRTTNFSTVHMAWPNLQAEENVIVDRSPSSHRMLSTMASFANDPCWKWDRPIPDDQTTNQILSGITFALSLAGFPALGACLTFFRSIFTKPAVTWESSFQIATCAAKLVAKQYIVDGLKGALNAMANELHDTYLPAKEAIKGTTGSTRTQAMDHANSIGVSILTSMRDNLGALSDLQLGFAAIVPYVIGASSVLALYQELSQVDSSVSKPADSTYITSLKTFAGEASGKVNAMVNNVRQNRSDAISVITDSVDISRCSGGIAPSCVTVGEKIIGAHWVDQITGESQTFDGKRNWSDADIQAKINECQNAMTQHRNAVMNKLNSKLDPLVKAASQFGNIPTPNPLPN